MALPNIFSRRKRQSLEVTSDVYEYVNFPLKLRHQILHMIDEQLDDTPFNGFHDSAVKFMRKELGVGSLTNDYHTYDQFSNWFLNHNDTDRMLDAVEICCKLILVATKQRYKPEKATAFCAELNARMLEAQFGYQVENFEIIQINNQFAHSQIVVPALNLIADPAYTTVNEEFRQAHSEFRAGEYEDCIHDCCNAFESTMKIICSQKAWSFDATDPASKLISVILTNGLIPTHMQAEFTGLRTMLESGVPTLRNKTGGHGAGVQPRVVPAHIAAFQLHQTAAAIILLIEAAKS